MSGSGRDDDDDAANGLKPKPRVDSATTPQPGTDHAQQPHTQQHHGADAAHQVTKPGAGTLVSPGGGIGGLFARPAYNQKLTYEPRVPSGPVEPLHGPGETPQVAVTLPMDFERCNPQLIVNQLRAVIEPAQAAAIDAACAAKDLPRARQLLRDVLSSIAKRVNATGDAVALAPLKQAGRAAYTWEAVKSYVAAAHFLRRLERGRTQGRASTPASTATAAGTGAVGTAHTPTSSGADAAPSAAPAPSLMHQPAPAPSMLAVAPTPRFDQLPMMMPPRSMLAVAQAPTPKAKPARALQVDPVRDAADDQRADDKLQAGVAQYTEIHRAEIARAVAAMIDDKRHGWPQPSARIDWQNQGQFSQALSNLIVAQVQAEDIAALVAPYSLTTAYAQHVAPLKQAAKAAAPAFCGAVALLLQRVVFASVQRIGARVESLIADGVAPHSGGVVTSHPVDSSVVTAMTLPGVLDAHRVKAIIGTATAKASVASVASLRSVTVHWLGRTDATLWNYLRTEPADASCEEVAVAIAGGKRSASEQAYQISMHGDRFQVAPTLARRAIAAHFAGEVVGPVRNDAFAAQPGAALAASPEGDDAALAQAAGLGTPQAAQGPQLGDKQPGSRTRDAQLITLQGVLNVQRDIGVQLHAIHTVLAPLALASLIAPAEAFRARNVVALTAGDIHVWTQWLPVLNAQHLLLIDIAQRVVPAAQQALRLDIAARLTRQSPANAQALRALVKIYARAAGASHVPSSSQEILAELTAAQAQAQLDQIDRSELDLQNAAADGAVRAQAGATNEAQAKLDAARTHTLQGDADSHEINEAQIAAREPALRRRMAAAEPALTKLLATVQAKRSILSTHEFYFLPIALEAAQVRLHRVDGVWLEHTRLNGKAGATLIGSEKWLARDAGVTAAEQAFAQIGGDETLAALLRRGANLVDHQYKELAEDCAKLAVILMLTVVTAGIAAEVAGAAEIAMLARAQRVMAYAGEIAGLTPEATAMIASTVARGVGLGTNLVVDTAINTGVQAVTQGGDVKRGAIDNLIMSGFNRLFAGPMAALHATEIEAAAMSRLGRAKLFVTGVTVEALAGMMQGELTRLTTATMGMQNAHSGGFSDELLQQGAGIALGKHFQRMRQRWTQHEARIDAVYREEAEWLQLKAAREAFFAQADALAVNLSPDPAAGARLLAKNVALSEQEMALKRRVDVRPSDGATATHAHASATKPQIATNLPTHEVVAGPSAKVGHGSVPVHEHAAGAAQSSADGRPPHVPDQAAIDRQIAGPGHAQTDLHSHFLGNVAPEKFAVELAASGTATMKPADAKAATAAERIGDVSTWEPLLREIAKLEKGLPHEYHDNADGAGDKIAKRGAAGDAIKLSKDALVEIQTLKKELTDSELKEGPRAALQKEIESIAKSTVEKCLRASDQTDFNSGYEVRDELIKKFYGSAERNSVLGEGATIVSAQAKLTEHFADRPAVQARIDRVVELSAEKSKRALTKNEADDLKAQTKLIEEQFAYDKYTEDTLVRLAQDNVAYTEQSNSVNKLKTRFDEGQLDWAKQRAKAAHPELAAQLDALQVKHVAMITTEHLGARNADVSDIDTGRHAMSSRGKFEMALKDVGEIMQRKDVVGMDIAGMEQHQFSKEGQARYIETIDMMVAVAKQRGKPMVSRPHVGEGAIDVVPGDVFARDGNRQTTAAGELSHYARARENIEALLESLETVANRKENGGRLPPEVIVRFGHATHTTPQQAARMAKLGVIVEVNLGSNQASGAVAQNKPLPGQPDVRVEPNAKGGTFAESKQSLPGLDDHALATMVFNHVDVVLSTDGHDVMDTTLGKEFELARKVMLKIQKEGQKIRISYEQAVTMNAKEGGHANVDGAKPQSIIEVSYAQLSEKRRGFIDNAYRKFFETAQRYVAQQATHGRDAMGGKP